MKETQENVEDAEMAAMVAEQENRKSQWIKASEVQKCKAEMDVLRKGASANGIFVLRQRIKELEQERENLRKMATERLELIKDIESNMTGANQFRDGQITVFEWILRELKG